MIRSFTTEDFARRMEHAAAQAADARLTGLLVTPGPDLVYLTGYAPIAITERITLLAIHPGRTPSLIAPILERPDAEAAPAAGALEHRIGPANGRVVSTPLPATPACRRRRTTDGS